MEMIKDLWAVKKNRQIVVMSVIGVVVVGMALAMNDDTRAQRKQIEQMQVPKSKDGSFFSAAPAAQAINDRDAQAMVEKMTEELQKREAEIARRESDAVRQNQQLAERQAQLEKQLFEQKQQMQAIMRGEGTVASENSGKATRNPPKRNQQQQQLQDPVMQQQAQPMYDARGNLINQTQRQIVTQNPAALSGGQVIRTVTQRNVREFKDGKVNERPVEIHTLNARTQKTASPAVAQAKTPLEYEEEEGVEIFTLSMGSIISGTLLNGVAAPTSSDRKQEPMPVLMRVKREAIMPNHFTLDIIDCHLLGSAIGDLSSNRAYIRAEAISCNTANGEAIEKQITAYAVSSSDGMAGIQGDVVFKSGAMIANSLRAEFIRGFADTLTPRRVQSLNTTPGATELWQSQNIDRAAGAGIGSGMSSAAGRIADKYMDMADAAQPVIELLPGIEVDFIVQKGMTLKLGGREAPYTGNRMGDREPNTQGKNASLPSVSVNVN